MDFEVHCMFILTTELSLFNYDKVKSVLQSVTPFSRIQLSLVCVFDTPQNVHPDQPTHWCSCPVRGSDAMFLNTSTYLTQQMTSQTSCSRHQKGASKKTARKRKQSSLLLTPVQIRLSILNNWRKAVLDTGYVGIANNCYRQNHTTACGSDEHN